MAYKLPSVFNVQLIDGGNECILFGASKRSELESKLNGLYGECACVI